MCGARPTQGWLLMSPQHCVQGTGEECQYGHITWSIGPCKAEKCKKRNFGHYLKGIFLNHTVVQNRIMALMKLHYMHKLVWAIQLSRVFDCMPGISTHVHVSWLKHKVHVHVSTLQHMDRSAF